MSRDATRSADAVLSRACWHACLQVWLFALPWIALCLMFAIRYAGRGLSWLPVLASTVVALAWLAAAWRSRNLHWLARQFNQHPAFEDSAGLLLGLDPPVSPLAHLQRVRLQARWQTLDPGALLPRQSTRAWVWNLLAVLVCAAALWAWQQPLPEPVRSRLPPVIARVLGVQSPSLRSIQMQVDPPAYTGLPSRSIDAPDAVVPESSAVTWALRFSVAPARAWLQFEQGPRIELQLRDGGWRGTHAIDQSMLYRIVTEPALPLAQRGLHRIQMLRDQPPQVRATTPARSLSLRRPGQLRWPLVFTASDDHGIAARAELRIIQTSGDGENIQSSERILTLTGTGTTRARTFGYAFDLARSGLSVGNDVIVQLRVRDNRQPRPQEVSSASVILRWPPEAVAMADGMDGLVQRVLPAYFRSQRQIIIDAEKLIRERPRLANDVFVRRADSIGVDQHALRLRYGQFLGEEGEDAPALPTNDVDDHPSTPAATSSAAPGHIEDAVPHADESSAGNADAMLANIGHAHDLPEAATLLDPQTQAVLRAALREMWQSEMHLRQGEPGQALPFAHKALALIKQVQQADRIHLPRIGNELPPIDFDRRLSGKRDGLALRSDGLLAKPVVASPLDALWRSLAADRDASPLAASSVDAAARWLHAHGDSEGNALATLAALDSVRRQPACQPCRQALRETIWPLLKPAATRPLPRPRASAAGDAYLDALQRELAR